MSRARCGEGFTFLRARVSSYAEINDIESVEAEISKIVVNSIG